MAGQQRNNNSTFSQEPTHQIIRVALYARVSTLNSQDPEMQLSELREYAGHRGLQITEEYIDVGVSGCKESRPALNRLMADASRRRFDAILVWKIDRFGRSLKHLVNSLAELAALGFWGWVAREGGSSPSFASTYRRERRRTMPIALGHRSGRVCTCSVL
jgi:predicted site-specific integrase-resolvase